MVTFLSSKLLKNLLISYLYLVLPFFSTDIFWALAIIFHWSLDTIACKTHRVFFFLMFLQGKNWCQLNCEIPSTESTDFKIIKSEKRYLFESMKLGISRQYARCSILGIQKWVTKRFWLGEKRNNTEKSQLPFLGGQALSQALYLL